MEIQESNKRLQEARGELLKRLETDIIILERLAEFCGWLLYEDYEFRRGQAHATQFVYNIIRDIESYTGDIVEDLKTAVNSIDETKECKSYCNGYMIQAEYLRELIRVYIE